MSKVDYKLYGWFADRIAEDLGPSALKTPVWVTFSGGAGLHYPDPRSMYEGVLAGEFSMEDVKAVEIAGERYAPSNEGWTADPILDPFSVRNDGEEPSLLQRVKNMQACREGLVGALASCYSAEELGVLFDVVASQIAGPNATLTSLAASLGEAWDRAVADSVN